MSADKIWSLPDGRVYIERGLPPGTGYLVDLNALRLAPPPEPPELSRQRDDLVRSFSSSFLQLAAFGLGYHDTLTRPKALRARLRETWRLLRRAWRSGDPWDHDEFERLVERAFCMLFGHPRRDLAWTSGRVTCPHCGGVRALPETVLKFTLD